MTPVICSKGLAFVLWQSCACALNVTSWNKLPTKDPDFLGSCCHSSVEGPDRAWLCWISGAYHGQLLCMQLLLKEHADTPHPTLSPTHHQALCWWPQLFLQRIIPVQCWGSQCPCFRIYVHIVANSSGVLKNCWSPQTWKTSSLFRVTSYWDIFFFCTEGQCLGRSTAESRDLLEYSCESLGVGWWLVSLNTK